MSNLVTISVHREERSRNFIPARAYESMMVPRDRRTLEDPLHHHSDGQVETLILIRPFQLGKPDSQAEWRALFLTVRKLDKLAQAGAWKQARSVCCEIRGQRRPVPCAQALGLGATG